MLDRTRKTVTLSTWSLEKRGRYWYASKPQFFQEQGAERGPFSSILSACLTIGKELAKEATRHYSKA